MIRRRTLLAQGLTGGLTAATMAAGLAGRATAQEGLPDGTPRDDQKDQPGVTPDWGNIDITGTAPSLSLQMQATPDGREVTQDAFRGSVSMLYFGYTFCPDICPLVMQNVVATLAQAKDAGRQVRFLFVTVDPNRDTNQVLTDYTQAFGPQFTGLRGNANQLDRLARRYRVAYSVSPSPDPRLYEVAHSSSIFVFDRKLNARLLVPSMASQNPDIDGVARELTRLVTEKPSAWDWLRGLV
ncbi:MAG TPA: SCO family protein [Rhodopila sp.]|uniref:SCO family protein n=1 Tax=Rhodopila sp. TaxID=2480087 RepID=UPI002C4AC740|nr:SCO family protein [Rhodopila sp.]HVY13921.1 SCO family protein [Rhodopila sp.]